MHNSPAPLIFDRSLVRRHIARARPQFKNHSALFDDTAMQLSERIGDVRREFAQKLDLSPFPFLADANAHLSALDSENEVLPLMTESYDLIASNLDLHWINDVPGILTQIHAALKKEGMFIGTIIGEQSLSELRACLLDAELAVTGGISPRLSPTIDLLSASQLMQRAGFTLPVADMETVTLVYKDMFALMHDLRGMGQTNAHTQRLRTTTRKAVFWEAARLYQERFGDENGHISATFDVIYLHGWK